MKKIALLLIMTIALYASIIETYIPERAKVYLPLVLTEMNLYLPEFKEPYYIGSLIEQESCVALKGKGYWARRCWSPISELKTDREQGVGFGQITRAWKKNGSIRFDTLRHLKKKYPKELKELNWDNIKKKPELQIRAMVLLWRDNYLYFKKDLPEETKIALANSMYNGGLKYLLRERKECGLRKDCDATKWFGNIELVKSARAKRKLYGNRSAWDINRDHSKKIILIRGPKYREWFIKYSELNKPITNDKVKAKVKTKVPTKLEVIDVNDSIAQLDKNASVMKTPDDIIERGLLYILRFFI